MGQHSRGALGGELVVSYSCCSMSAAGGFNVCRCNFYPKVSCPHHHSSPCSPFWVLRSFVSVCACVSVCVCLHVTSTTTVCKGQCKYTGFITSNSHTESNGLTIILLCLKKKSQQHSIIFLILSKHFETNKCTNLLCLLSENLCQRSVNIGMVPPVSIQRSAVLYRWTKNTKKGK